MTFAPHVPSRRQLLLGSGALFAWAHLPRAALAEGRDPRLLVIVLRGALDGLAAVAPIGDPDWIRLRGDQALTLEGPTPALPLDSYFALNPAMPNLHRMYHAKTATIVHAVASPYRERSHFDGQDVLESGMTKPGSTDSGWLNRALGTLQPAGRLVGKHAFAGGPVTPLVVRGPAPVVSWSPPKLPPASDDTVLRLLDLYQHTDPMLARALEERIDLAAIAHDSGVNMGSRMAAGGAPRVPGAAIKSYFAEAATAAANFMARDGGPRIGALAFDGWDTHAAEGASDGRLALLLSALDGALGSIERGMGASWKETAIVVITEFGRTARINGTAGTDHGTATVAFLAGGALNGGRVIADWPGLSDRNLFQGRDLMPTTDLRAILKGLLRDHLGVDEHALASTVFPDSASVRATNDLLS